MIPPKRRRREVSPRNPDLRDRLLDSLVLLGSQDWGEGAVVPGIECSALFPGDCPIHHILASCARCCLAAYQRTMRFSVATTVRSSSDDETYLHAFASGFDALQRR